MRKQMPKRVKRHAGGVWEVGARFDAVTLAEQLAPGDLVYAPPPAVPRPRARRDGTLIDPGVRPEPPDLAPLSAALAARGLELEPQGAFYFVVAAAAGNRPAAGSTIARTSMSPGSRPAANHPWRAPTRGPRTCNTANEELIDAHEP